MDRATFTPFEHRQCCGCGLCRNYGWQLGEKVSWTLLLEDARGLLITILLDNGSKLG
jgi:hypothetical protein